MKNCKATNALLVLTATFTLGGCSEPAAPGLDDTPAAARFINDALPGSYELFFMIETPTGLMSVDNNAPVRSFLVLRSAVKDNSGVLATVGKVTYEHCWSKGDYAPSAVCAAGLGSWKRLYTMSVDLVGSRFGFGSCSTPRTIGFRFTYTGRGAISSGTSVQRDFTWY